MSYNEELSLLRDTLRKCHVRTLISPPESLEAELADFGIEAALGRVPLRTESSRRFPRNPEPRTVYRVTDEFGFSYVGLLLPEAEAAQMLCVGPYLAAAPSHERLLELGERHRVPPAQQRYFEEWYAGTPVLAEGDRLFILLDSFCERVWCTPSFAIVDRNREVPLPASPISGIAQIDGTPHDTTVDVKAMEQRYRFENELMRAVTLGQIHKEKQLISAFSESSFEKRLADPLRNAKNYGIIMNTLLRKAAEEGGVHPVYLDRVSSQIAGQIERLPSLSETTALMCSIFRTYCRLVRSHALKGYSQVVQKTVLLIESDLSAELSLHLLAERLKVSAGYLCAIFKRDTGKTVSEYIREKRIRHAAHLLGTTHLQIQTVALHCGIMDVQYFSKIFKRRMGKTPKEYREEVHRSQR